MKYLLYCIFCRTDPAGQDGVEMDMPLGIEDRPVFLLRQKGLSAAVSEVNLLGRGVVRTPDILHLLAYKRVIESFHENPAIKAVIPMRYGCFFEEESQVLRLLEEHDLEYKSLLEELEGCVEMGIRVIFPDPENQTSEKESKPPDSAVFNPKWPNSGSAYLAARRAHYVREEQLTREKGAILERCQGAFSRLSLKCHAEILPFPFLPSKRCGPYPPAFADSRGSRRTASLGPPLFAEDKTGGLYFLIPRIALESFRQTFRQVSLQEQARLLLSGPWPPYNFVNLR